MSDHRPGLATYGVVQPRDGSHGARHLSRPLRYGDGYGDALGGGGVRFRKTGFWCYASRVRLERDWDLGLHMDVNTIDPVTADAVRQFLSRVPDSYDMAGAILYGSRARGSYRPDSEAEGGS